MSVTTPRIILALTLLIVIGGPIAILAAAAAGVAWCLIKLSDFVFQVITRLCGLEYK